MTDFTKIYLLIFLAVLMVGCHNNISKSGNDIQQYVIQKADYQIRTDSITGEPIQVFREFYFDYNIILIDSIGSIYFHKKRFYCLTGSDVWNNTLPVFRNLKSDYFEKLDEIELLLNEILDSENETERVYLISNKDTISDTRYFKLKQNLLENGIKVSTRLITEEETVIMTTILKNMEYNPNEINWERTLSIPTEIEEDTEIEEIKNMP